MHEDSPSTECDTVYSGSNSLTLIFCPEGGGCSFLWYIAKSLSDVPVNRFYLVHILCINQNNTISIPSKAQQYFDVVLYRVSFNMLRPVMYIKNAVAIRLFLVVEWF